jgi:hypothetical protein
MGLLDDAIREHLDLKRRRGADPSEVERAEREALGPVRRNREPAEAVQPGDQSEAGGVAYDHAEEDGWTRAPASELQAPDDLGDEFDEDGFAPADPYPAGRAPVEEALDREPLQAGSWSHDEGEDKAAEPFAVGRPSSRPLSDIGGGETVEYNVEEALASTSEHAAEHEAEAESDGEDVLEETPEFLQDTPDHDRLWFEQRPPKDFDFDG